jgi:hypothetical protein
MSEPIVNKVADSGLVTLDLETYYPNEAIAEFDLKDYLFMGLVLKEKDFREALKKIDWEMYRGSHVGVVCTTDAIIPPWAYMLVASYLQPVAADVFLSDAKRIQEMLFLKNIRGIDLNDYIDQRVVVKGCGDKPIGDFAYLEVTKLLRPVAKTIMYGEPCSTVPIYKKKS